MDLFEKFSFGKRAQRIKDLAEKKEEKKKEETESEMPLGKKISEQLKKRGMKSTKKSK